ncbi:SMC-Scp complex subunit ScpB [Candidatus Falkowbacteria bacterium]|nr:SMC-Scp complex subunit ScpB [Candidatus Falkowbacteria bacterium]
MSTLQSKLESLLFISPKPFGLKQLPDLVGADREAVGEALKTLMTEYAERGIIIKKVDDKFQMMTSGDNYKLAQDFVREEITGELTRPSLETLTVIAYRGPVSKPELEMIRGVNCSMIIRNLLMRGLIEETEDKQRGYLYQVTLDFLKFLGIQEARQLPDFDKLNNDENLQKLLLTTLQAPADEAASE